MAAGAIFAQAGPAVTLSPALTVSDADNATLASATVSIAGGFLAGDTLGFTNQGGITGSYNAATGVLSLSGSATVAQYQAALKSVSFSSSNPNPTNFGTDTSRSISWVVNDGALNSNQGSTIVTITGVDQAPVIGNAGNTIGYTELQAVAPAIDAALTVSDADNATLTSATVSIAGGFLAGTP